MLNLLINAGEAVAADEENAREVSTEADQPSSTRLAFSISDSGVGVKDSGERAV